MAQNRITLSKTASATVLVWVESGLGLDDSVGNWRWPWGKLCETSIEWKNEEKRKKKRYDGEDQNGCIGEMMGYWMGLLLFLCVIDTWALVELKLSWKSSVFDCCLEFCKLGDNNYYWVGTNKPILNLLITLKKFRPNN